MQDTERIDPWQERWSAKTTGWDQGGPHPLLRPLVDAVYTLMPHTRGGKVYAAGCGRAHNEAALAQLGFEVTAEDFVPQAITEAQALYHACPRLTLRCADVFRVEPCDEARYDIVFDRAMYCAIQPKFRSAYLKAVLCRLKPGGLFMGIPFVEKTAETAAEGPPFAAPLVELMSRLRELATLVYWQERPVVGDLKTVTTEATMIWRKRS